MKNRIWELDAFRGLCVLGMVIVHFVYDLAMLYRIIDWEPTALFLFIKDWGGLLFLVLSGICATLGSRSLRRGAIVLGCGFLITAVTWVMVRFMSFHESMIIYFGVLHCLGICMMLWPLFRKLPWWTLALLGAALIAGGFAIKGIRVDTPWLIFLGLRFEGFATSDYFPLLPNLGYFLIGGAVGKTLYRNKQTLFPGVNDRNPVIRFLTGCGRQSLPIYLLHQPVLSGISFLLSLIL